MATATLTAISPPRKRGRRLVTNGKGGDDPLSTLRSLYPTAARAFLRRDVLLTQSLIDTAFTILHANPVTSTPLDAYTSHRRKWDLLRITLETTLYSSLDSGAVPATVNSTNTANAHAGTGALDGLPAHLRSNLGLPASSLLGTLCSRSIRLYTPASPSPSTQATLPSQIVVALAFAALKLNCPDFARNLVEEWLARTSQNEVTFSGEVDNSASPSSPELSNKEGYERVLDTYCLHVLPRLGDWEYAFEFLQYETELGDDKRKQIYTSLRTLHAQALNPPQPIRQSSSSSEEPLDRPVSPASSTSSASTHTAVPASFGLIGGGAKINSRSTTLLQSSLHPSPTPSPSPSSLSTTSQQTVRPSALQSRLAATENTVANGSSALHNTSKSKSKSKSRTRPPPEALSEPNSSTPSSPLSHPRPPLAPPLISSSNSSTRLSLLEAFRQTYLPRNLTKTHLWLLVVLVPVIAFVLRLRRGRGRGVPVGRNKLVGGTGDRRLIGRTGTGTGRQGVVRWLMGSVRDTIVMAGKGLV